jgi:aspartyl-tRNA(Asn)/glutamyl-tRNA(Gln) amidotransferase subunit A
MLDGIDPQIASAWEKAREIFQKNGAIIKEVSLAHAIDSIKVYYFTSTAEASSNLARYDGIKYGHKTQQDYKNIEEMVAYSRSEGFGEEVKNRILIGTRNLMSDSYTENYERILRLRNAIKHEFATVFKNCDALLCPTTPNLPFAINYQQTELEEYINDILTVPVNIAGLPAISVPFGKATCKRPIGFQLIAKEFNERTLFETALFLEQNS